MLFKTQNESMGICSDLEKSTGAENKKCLILFASTIAKGKAKPKPSPVNRVVSKYAMKDGKAFLFQYEIEVNKSQPILCEVIAQKLQEAVLTGSTTAEITDQLDKSSDILDCPEACFVLLYITQKQVKVVEKLENVEFGNILPVTTATHKGCNIIEQLNLRLVNQGNKVPRYAKIVGVLALLASGGGLLYNQYKAFQKSKVQPKQYEIFYDPKSSHLQFDPKSVKIKFFTKFKKKHRNPMEMRLGKRATAAHLVFKKFPKYLTTYKEYFIRRKDLFGVEDLQDIIDSDYADNFVDVMIRVTVQLLYVVRELKTKVNFFTTDAKIRQKNQVLRMAERFWSNVRMLFPSLGRSDIEANLARAIKS